MKTKTRPAFARLFFLSGFLILAGLLYWYGERWLHLLIVYLAKASWARRVVSHWPIAWRVASRFVAGEDIQAAITASRGLNEKGMLVTLDYLGENVTNAQEAMAARNAILELLDCIKQTSVNANVSVKLSQLGIKVDEALALDNMRRLLERAQQYGNKIRIDMEESILVDKTLNLYRTLRDDYGFRNTGVVIQAYLYRSEADVRQLVDEGAWIRLCKGAYAEPPDVAFANKADTDANFVRLMQLMLGETARRNGVLPAIATHDEKMIEATIDYISTHNIARDAFEFQMLYGVRRELQESLVASGYQMRVYVPYGTAWYPYLMRRLAERPANLWFFISNFFRR